MVPLLIQFMGGNAPGGDCVYAGLVLSLSCTLGGNLLFPQKHADRSMQIEMEGW